MHRNLIWYTKITAIVLWFILGTIIYSLIILPKSKSPKNNLGYVRFVGPMGRRILGLKYIVRSSQLYETQGPAVYIMNHQSALDVLANFDFYPADCIVIVKKALVAVPFFGWIIARGDNIGVERTNPRQSMASMKEARSAMENKKYSVWIFPEGTRRNTAEIHKLKHGAFHLALQTNAPIIPVVTSSYCRTVDFNKINSGTIIVEVLPPIATTGLTTENIETLVSKCHKVMSEALDKNTREAMQKTEAQWATI